MSFTSIPFLFFFLILFFGLYYLLPIKLKNVVILIFSLIFYLWGSPIYYIFLILLTALSDFFFSLLGKKKPERKKFYLIIAVIINILLLGFFKYADFIIGTVNSLAGSKIPLLKLALPTGISFYIFQSMSYSFDVYRNKYEPEDNFFKYLVYISMFPKLTSGPIVRYNDIKNDLDSRVITKEKAFSGAFRFIEGFIKKILLANVFGKLFAEISSLESISMLSGWLGLLGYSFQLYFDFSSYSDMAIGLGRMMGFEFKENFNYPYLADSITDFWRRWHISLSMWFRDYIYIPMGGNRCGVFKQIINLLTVWLLTGLWHGAAFNFIFWGLYYGIILIIEKFVLKKVIKKTPYFIRRIVTMFIVMIGWCLFVFSDVPSLWEYLKVLFNFHNIVDVSFIYYLKNYIVYLAFGIILCSPKIRIWLAEKHNIVVNILLVIIFIVLFVVSISALVSDSYMPFLYGKF